MEKKPLYSRRNFLKTSIAATSVLGAAASSRVQGAGIPVSKIKKPNILLIFADQWTFWAMGHRGNKEIQTPCLDRFARQGVNCHHAISGTPVCTPARASLITGLRPDAHGLYINDAPLNPELPGMGKHFAAAGYDTAWIGKWHIDGHGRKSYIPPERRHGFSYFKALECTHDYNNSPYYDNNDSNAKTWSGYDAFAQSDDLIDWLGKRDSSKPFLTVLSWGPPHSPYDTAPEEYRKRYSPEKLTLRSNVPQSRAEEYYRIVPGYYAHCEALDTAFGRIMDELDRRGLSQDTIVVFTSDHGDMLVSHGLWEKQCPWEESLRIPMLLRGPGLPVGQGNNSIMDFIDLWPTLSGLAGIPLAAKIHGRDLSRELRGGGTPEDNSGYYASYSRFGNWLGQDHQVEELYRCREARGLRTERHLYVEDLKGPWLLYDMGSDPLQQNNLVNQPAQAGLQRALAQQLRDRRALYGDKFLSGGEYNKRWSYAVNERGTLSH